MNGTHSEGGRRDGWEWEGVLGVKTRLIEASGVAENPERAGVMRSVVCRKSHRFGGSGCQTKGVGKSEEQWLHIERGKYCLKTWDGRLAIVVDDTAGGVRS